MGDFIQGIERILILRTDGIGDVLNSTPAISALREAYRDARISVLARHPGVEALLLNPHIDELLTYDATARLRSVKKLRAGCYDMAIVLHNSSWCNLMAYLSGAQYRVGRRSERKRFSFTLTHGVISRDPKGTKHEIDRNMDVVSLVGAKDGTQELIFRLSVEERAWAKDFLHREDIYTPLVGIHPGGSSFDKLWPAENFAYTANELAKRLEAKIMLFGGPGEEALLHDVQRYMVNQRNTPEVTSVTGLPLRQFAALLEKCSIFLCNDSGPMHIAAALKVPTVAIFGPTDHVRWGPRSEKAVIVRKDVDCWPCSAHKCRRGFECIKTLPVDWVLKAADSMLN
jgi:heptosyltransferase-2